MEYSKNYKFVSGVSKLFQRKIAGILRDKKVLDLGCGDGSYLAFFGKGSAGIDLSPKNIATAKAKSLKITKGDINKFDGLGDKFEALFLSHVLEHVDSPVNLLKACNKKLSKGGIVVISVPNENSLIHLKYPYFTRDGNHLYSFSVDNMLELLSVSGFIGTEVLYDYYSEMTRKLGLDDLLQFADILPTMAKNKLAWATWFIAKK